MRIAETVAPNSPDASSSKVTGHEVLQSANSEPSLLSSSKTPLVSPELKRAPDSVSVESSLLEDQSEKTHEPQSSSKGDDAKSTRSTSNKYSNKTKAKVHLGACSIGALTFGILAGPVGLVFAPAYLNAICMATYGGQGFLVGDNNTNQAKPDLEKSDSDQPTSSGRQVPPKPTSPNPEEGPSNDEEDGDKKDIPPGQFPFNGKGGNFTFAPVNINYAPNITINGNIYLQQAPEQSVAPDDNARKGTTTKDSEQQTDQVIQDNKVSVTNITKMTADQVSRAVNTQTSESGVEIAQELMVDEVDAHQVTFSDGAKAIITGLPEAAPSAHHRGKGFSAFNDASVKKSQQSYADEKAKKGSVKVGETHTWHKEDRGQWTLKPIASEDSVETSRRDDEQNINYSADKRSQNVSDSVTLPSPDSTLVRQGTTGVSRKTNNDDSVHHRGKGFSAFNDASVKKSQQSYADEKAKKGSVKVGETHTWHKEDRGQWTLKPIASEDSVETSRRDDEQNFTHSGEQRSQNTSNDVTSLNTDSTIVRQGSINENTQSTSVQPLDKGSESSPSEGLEPYKDSPASGVWTRKGSGWEQSSEGSPAILSPGSAQAIPGLHSNRSKGLFNNMEKFTLKKPEKDTPNDKNETRRSLGLVGNRVSYPLSLGKMVYKNNSASL